MRFEREARILARLRSLGGIVEILDIRLGGAMPYFVMEFCAGGSLRSIAHQANSWRMVAALLEDVGVALNEVHAQGGFHRDLKPDNLLIAIDHEGRRRLKIADFGLARIPSSSSGPITRHPCGTLAYMAPEVRAHHQFSPSADVFSLGMTGLELLTGGLVPSELDQSDAPSELQRLLRGMIDIDPSRRPSMSEVVERVSRLLVQPESPRAVPPPAQTQAAPRRGSDVGRVIAGTLLGGLLAAAFVAAIEGGASGTERNGRNRAGYDASVDRYRGPDGRFRRKPR